MPPDFEDVVDEGVVFSEDSESTDIDFVDSGDFGLLVVTEKIGFGEEGFGEGPFGGVSQHTEISVPTTTWTDIETP